MGFQIAGLVADPGVASGVGLVEGIFREFPPVIVNLLQLLFRESVCHASVDEFLAELFDDGNLFLSHCLAQLVCFAFGESCELL